MRYSLIIPVFNSEKTVARCIESIVSQDFDDYEILLINDGSTDKSDALCKEFSEKYRTVKYFKKENGGVSSARNLGLEKASGKYVLFVDSDDEVSGNYFEALNEMTEKNDCDMYMFSCRLSDGRNEEIRQEQNAVYGADSVFDAVSFAIRNRRINVLWCKAFLNERIKQLDLRFSNDIYIGEDQLFCVTYALHIKSLCTSDKIIYNVSLENGESLSRKRRDDLSGQLISGHKKMFEALKSAKPEETANEKLSAAIAYSFYRSAYSSSKELLKYDMGAKERRRRIKEVCRAFCEEKVPAKDFKTFVISLPVRMKAAFLIDKAIGLKK